MRKRFLLNEILMMLPLHVKKMQFAEALENYMNMPSS